MYRHETGVREVTNILLKEEGNERISDDSRDFPMRNTGGVREDP